MKPFCRPAVAWSAKHVVWYFDGILYLTSLDFACFLYWMKLIQRQKPCSLWLQSCQCLLVWNQHINFILLVSHCNTWRRSILWRHRYCNNMPFWHRSSYLINCTIQFPIYMEAFADLQLHGLWSAWVDDGFLYLTLLDFACFVYWIKWYNLRSCWRTIFSCKNFFSFANLVRILCSQGELSLRGNSGQAQALAAAGSWGPHGLLL